MKLTPQDVYDRLLHQDGICQLHGQINYTFGNVSIVVKQKDVVGNIIQEWVKGWFDSNGIEYDCNNNSQMPPDFYLDPEDHTHHLLEVKAFNYGRNPAFDIADFRMYHNEIIEKPYMLDAFYLIFGYSMDGLGRVTINELWLKKVWEITSRMDNWPIKLQVKENVVHKMRPGIWFSGNARYRMFSCLEHFLSAIEETTYQNPATRVDAGTWKARFLASYYSFYHRNLTIPRWDEIKDSYLRTT